MTTIRVAPRAAGLHQRWKAMAWIALLLLMLFAIVTVLLGTTARSALAKSKSSSASWSDSDSRSGRDFEWNGALKAGQTLEVHGINGPIRARPSEGREARVRAKKSGRKSDPDEVKIEVEQTEDGVRICARYPRPDGSLNDCLSQNTRNNDVEVDFRLDVPAGVHLVAETVNGEVEIDGVSGDVRASTVNGSVEVTTTGEAEAQTVNGGIHARIGSKQWTGALSFETVNGSVVVTLPDGVNADVKASTVNGEISSDFEMAVSGRISSRRLRGVIGKGGGGQITLSTVNGGIELRSGTSSASR